MGSGGSSAKKRAILENEIAQHTQAKAPPPRLEEVLPIETKDTLEKDPPPPAEVSKKAEYIPKPVTPPREEHKQAQVEPSFDVRGSMDALPEAPAKLPSPEFSPVRVEEYRTQVQMAPDGPDLLQEEMLSSIDAPPMSPPIKKPRKFELSARENDSQEGWKPDLKPVLSTHPEDSPHQDELFSSFKDTHPPVSKSVLPESCQSPEIGRGKVSHGDEESLDEEILRSIEGLPISPPHRHPGKLDLTESAGHELDSLLNLMDSK